jgi:5'-3' exonuclease
MIERLLNNIGTVREIRGVEVSTVNGIPLSESSKLVIADLILKKERGVKKTYWKLDFNKYQLFWMTKNLPRDYEFYQKVIGSEIEEDNVVVMDGVRPVKKIESERDLMGKDSKRYSKRISGRKNKINMIDYEDMIIETVSKDYYKTLIWIYAYYTRGLSSIDNTFFFKWHYPPTVRQLYLASLDIYEKGFFSSRGRLMLNPLQQLVTVLPPQSKKIIPDLMAQKLISLGEREAELADLSPQKVKLELEGAKADFKPYALVPPIDIDRVVRSVEKLVRVKNTDPLLFVREIDLEY